MLVDTGPSPIMTQSPPLSAADEQRLDVRDRLLRDSQGLLAVITHASGQMLKGGLTAAEIDDLFTENPMLALALKNTAVGNLIRCSLEVIELSDLEPDDLVAYLKNELLRMAELLGVPTHEYRTGEEG